MMKLPEGTTILKTVGLTKRFKTLTAVDQLNLEVRAGEVLGFLGPNGSGKSTTVGMMLGLIAPTAGQVQLFDRDLADDYSVIARQVGAIIETPAFYPYLSGRDNLRALALAVGGIPEARIDDLLTMVGLRERADSKFKTYSLGMKQRLGIASTLLNDPALVILDEPTNGLDPAGQREIREIIPRLAREGRGVLLASHLLHEVEQVCDRVAIIRNGRLVEEGDVDDLLRRSGYLEVEVADADLDAGLRALRRLPFVEHVTAERNRLIIVAAKEAGSAINQALADQGIYANAIVPRRSTLEAFFLELTDEQTSITQDGTPSATVAA